MNNSICLKCSQEFEKSAADKTVICRMCDNDMKSDILVFQVFKWICYSLALAAISFIIPIAAAKETSPGYYTMPGGKGRPMSISEKGIGGWMIAIPIVTIGFGLAGFYLASKEDEKKSIYRKYQDQDNELSIK